MENACPSALYARPKRGGDRLVCLGQMYRLNKKNEDGTESRKRDAKAGCKAFAGTDAVGGGVVALPAHSHLSSPEAVAAAEIRGAIRPDAAAQPTERPARMAADAMSGKPRKL